MPRRGKSKKGTVLIKFGSTERPFKWKMINGVLRLHARGTPVERYINNVDLSKHEKKGFETLFEKIMLRSQMDKDPWPMVRMAAVGHNSLQYLWDVIHSHEEWKKMHGSIRFDDPDHQEKWGGVF